MISQIDWRGVVCQFLGVPIQADNNAILASLQGVTERLEAADRSLNTTSKNCATEDISYTTVHRINCREQGTTELSVGSPWPVKNADGQIHLRGSDLIEHVELFLERNKGVAFIVYKDYHCCKRNNIAQQLGSPSASTLESVPSLLIRESISIVSKDLREAFSELWFHAVDNIPHPDFDSDMEIHAPYLWWYWHRDRFREATISLDSPLIPPIRMFENYIEKSLAAEYDEVDKLVECGMITTRYMPYLYIPGEIQLFKGEGDDAQYWRAFRASLGLQHPGTDESLAEARIQYAGGCVRTIPGTNWTYDGCFQKEQRQWPVVCNVPWEQPFAIQDLVTYPLRFADLEVSDTLRRRGQMFWECRMPKYVSYLKDSAFRSQNPSDARYMIDINTFNEMHPPDKPRIMNKDDLGPKRLQSGQPPPFGDDFILCLPPTIPGYHMNKKEWITLHVSRIEPVDWNMNAFKLLVIDKEKKKLIKALVTNQIDAQEGTDLMGGKGNGLLILLHGPPGTGKTLTAESVAEIAQKPLYRVTCGDVGTKPEAVEKYLETVLLLGKTWGCVVLLDEADVFLMQRSTEDFERNALVSVFLRVLEYYDGILILTSNRVGTLDAAFKSRIQLSLQYPPLWEMDRLEIWKNFIEHIEGLAGSRTMALGIQSDEIRKRLPELAKEKLNGREIRNAVSTARQLAMFEEEPMGYKHLSAVVSEVKSFNSYATELQGDLTDDEIARQNREY